MRYALRVVGFGYRWRDHPRVPDPLMDWLDRIAWALTVAVAGVAVRMGFRAAKHHRNAS